MAAKKRYTRELVVSSYEGEEIASLSLLMDTDDFWQACSNSEWSKVAKAVGVTHEGVSWLFRPVALIGRLQ